MAKKVLLITFYTFGGGSELLFYRLSVSTSCELLSLPVNRRNIFMELYFMFVVVPKEIIKSKDPTIFMSSHYVLHILIMLYSKILKGNREYIYRISSDFHKRWPRYKFYTYYLIMNYLKGRRGRIIVQSLQAQADLTKYFKKSVEFIPNPVFSELNTLKSHDKPCFNDYVLCSGRLIKLKGFQDVIKAVEKVNINLVIVGDGDFRRDLMDLTDKLNLLDKVHFVGWIDNLNRYIEHAQVCVISSYVEGWPNVLNEMLAFNGNVICSDFSKDLYDLNIRTYSRGNVDALVEAISDAILHPVSINSHKEFLQKRSVPHYLKALRRG